MYFFNDLNSDMLGPGGLFGWIILVTIVAAAWTFGAWLVRSLRGKSK